MKGREHLTDLGIHGRIILEWILGGKVWTSSGLLWTWQWTFRFYKRQEISWLAEWLLASQGLCCM
jgi:hypothetical protein